MHGQLKIALKEVLKGALQQLLLEAGPFESFSKKRVWKHYLCYFLALSCYWYNIYPAEKHIQTVQDLGLQCQTPIRHFCSQISFVKKFLGPKLFPGLKSLLGQKYFKLKSV